MDLQSTIYHYFTCLMLIISIETIGIDNAGLVINIRDFIIHRHSTSVLTFWPEMNSSALFGKKTCEKNATHDMLCPSGSENVLPLVSELEFHGTYLKLLQNFQKYLLLA